MRPAFALAAIAACAISLSACHVFEREGRQQRATLTTSLTPQETRAAAEDWLGSRAQYRVTSSEPGFVRAEKQRPSSTRPGDQIDVISVDIDSVPEGTEVELEAITYEVNAAGDRNQADQVSPEAIRDIDELARALMPRP
jgi:hypothetical protein